MTAHHNPPPNYSNQYGASLIELILTIIIVSIALLGILSVVNLTTRHSADPIIQHQAIAIAESYLEEISLLPFTDPDGSNVGENRATFDNINDFDGLNDLSATDQNGSLITGLNLYNVVVNINDVTVSLINMKAITVTVSYPNFAPITLTGYRSDY